MDPNQTGSGYGQEFCRLLIAEVRRRLLDESLPRLRKCLNELSEEEIWKRPNAHSNSVGNLVLHLCGNVRQWILSGLRKAPDTRQRQQEFDERGPIPRAELLARLESTLAAVDEALNHIHPDDLLAEHDVQIYRESGLSILIHVVEHFSYHVGQVTYVVKAWKDLDMGYYAGVDLEGK